MVTARAASARASGRRGGAAGHRWNVFRQLVFATYGDTCWLCGHGGARQVDHIESVTEHPELVFSLKNCRPAHGAPGNRCRTCGQNCNQLRGAMSAERARRLITERSPGTIPGIKKAPRPVAADEGRDF